MHIAILTGWISTERTIALQSWMNISNWIKEAWYTSEVYDFPTDIHSFLKRYQASFLAKHFPTKTLKNHISISQDFDLYIPMFHGIYWEDGQVTAFLKMLDCRYAYSDFEVHALCIDKYKTNLLLEKFGIKIPESEIIQKNQRASWSISVIPFPLIIKPNKWWSSIWINKINNEIEYENAIKLITEDDILIQSCIEWREFTVWVYREKDRYFTLPIIEIKTIKQAFFDYEEKYESDGSNEIFLEWEDNLQKILSEESIKIAHHINCRWVIRIDYRYDWKDLYFLEVNTIPGFTSWSLIPKMWKKANKNEKEFIDILADNY